ncbi:MAG: type II toxin-antitoxin system RelE/ParE family toxin [Alphaproteobacteria bacterium]
MPLRWTFRSYVAPDGTDVIQDWFNHETKQARGKFRSKLRILGQLPFAEWRRPLFDTLADECTGLWEIRFDANHVPWRPLGFFQGLDTFTLVICASKDEHNWIPPNACTLGLARKAEILINPARCHDLPIPLE